MGKCYPAVSQEYKAAVDKCKRKLRSLIADKNCAPLMLRLAYFSLPSNLIYIFMFSLCPILISLSLFLSNRLWLFGVSCAINQVALSWYL